MQTQTLLLLLLVLMWYTNSFLIPPLYPNQNQDIPPLGEQRSGRGQTTGIGPDLEVMGFNGMGESLAMIRSGN